MKLQELRSVVDKLNLDDNDIIYGITYPDPDCKICGGSGIKDWDTDNHAIFCKCLEKSDTNNRPYLSFDKIKRYLTVTREDIYEQN